MRLKAVLYYLLVAFLACLFGSISFILYRDGLIAFAIVFVMVTAVFSIVYLKSDLYNYRFLFPGLAVLTLVILIPIGLMIKMSFETYRDASFLSYEQAEDVLLSTTYLPPDGESYAVAGVTGPTELALYLHSEDSGLWWKAVVDGENPSTVIPLKPINSAPASDFEQKFVLTHRALLSNVRLELPTGVQLVKSSLKRFSTRLPRYEQVESRLFLDQANGDLISADTSTGQFTVIDSVSEPRIGQLIPPLFISFSGLENYRRILSEDSHNSNLLKIVPWNFLSSLMTVISSLFVALVSASILSWEALKGRELIKTIIVGCFAFPAFAIISAFWTLLHGDAVLNGQGVGTVFVGPGILNQLLMSWFGISPDWLSDPWLSRLSFLVTQFWLTMPLMFILCLGAMPSIPRNIYEAALLEGAGVRRQFFSITAPLIIRQLAPVLIIIFALAFNDMALVNMLFRGWLVPAIENSTPVAMHTDLIVSYANRFALGGDAIYQQAQYSLGAALFTMLFIFIGMLSLIYLKVSKSGKAELTEKV